ncbi:ABC transporter ATP-binding protein [Emergencia timonensis]|uniref:ABC transporter ATP-binding protein n=1 Tax=Emergencia timonensis TaxID=1776384 RepID=UPI0039947AF5
MGTPLIQTKDLKKYFKTGTGMLHAVDNVNLSIEKGQTLGVVGESGCGKSTLGRTILRLLPATGGSVFFDGKDIQKLGTSEMKRMRSEMQIIFQDPYASLNPRLSVSQIIEEPLKVNHIYKNKEEKDRKILELMDTVGLARRLANSYPHELDGGRRQRIGVARALALNPSFIVCDEPVSALDVSIQAQVLNLMMDLQDSMGLTYMFITHDLSVVRHISTHIAVMYLGQVVEYAPSHQLFDDPKHPYTKALLSAIPIPDLAYRNKKRELIKGEITSPIDPKPGCRFAARCPYAGEKCTQKDLRLTDIGPEHQVACVMYENE